MASVTLSGGKILLWHHPSGEREATSLRLGVVGSPGSLQNPLTLKSGGLPHHLAGMKVLTPYSAFSGTTIPLSRQKGVGVPHYSLERVEVEFIYSVFAGMGG